MIKIKIDDINELDKMQKLMSEQTLLKYLEDKHPQLIKQAIDLNQCEVFEIDDIIHYISEFENTDEIAEISLDIAEEIPAVYGYIISE